MDETDNLTLLKEKALNLGATDAKVIPIDKVVIEDRVRLKCMVGCPVNGQNLRCPPYTPSVEEFRKIIGDYEFAMIIQLRTSNIPKEILDNVKNDNIRLQDLNMNELTSNDKVIQNYRNNLTLLLEIEREAFNMGYPFATVFFAGHCRLCPECNVKEGKCLNPVMSRYSPEAMGINLQKTAENANLNLKFNPEAPTIMAILLIN